MKILESIPSKFSKSWWWIFGAFFIGIFMFFLLSQYLTNRTISLPLVYAIALISFISALIVCLGGLLGYKMYFAISTIGTMLGILYMLYIVLFRTADGWGDIVSIISYLILYSFGIAIGIIAEVVYYFYAKNKLSAQQ